MVLIVGVALVLSYVVGIIVSGMKPQLGPPPLASSLGARVDLIVAYQEAFLDVVLWSMGLVGTLAVLLVGYSWFTTRETYERDLQALKDQIAAATVKQTTDLESARKDFASMVALEREAREAFEKVIGQQQAEMIAIHTAIHKDLVAAEASVDQVRTLSKNLEDVEETLLSTRCSVWMESARRYGGNIAIMDLTQVLFTASQMKHDAVDWMWVALQHAPIPLQSESRLEFKHLKDLHDTIVSLPANRHEDLAKRALDLIRARPEWKNLVP